MTVWAMLQVGTLFDKSPYWLLTRTEDPQNPCVCFSHQRPTTSVLPWPRTMYFYDSLAIVTYRLDEGPLSCRWVVSWQSWGTHDWQQITRWLSCLRLGAVLWPLTIEGTVPLGMYLKQILTAHDFQVAFPLPLDQSVHSHINLIFPL